MFIDFDVTACGRTQDGTLTAAKLEGLVIQRPAHTQHSIGPISFVQATVKAAPTSTPSTGWMLVIITQLWMNLN